LAHFLLVQGHCKTWSTTLGDFIFRISRSIMPSFRMMLSFY